MQPLKFLHLPLFTLLLISCFCLRVTSQPMQAVDIDQALLDEIYKDIWQPFMESYRDLDKTKLLALHSPEIIKVTSDLNLIESGEAYLENFASVIDYFAENQQEIDIRFSVSSTAKGANRVYQAGYYCFSSKGPDDEALVARGYSRFSVLLVNIDGSWKIAVDTDGRTTMTEEEFLTSGTLYQLKP